MGAKRWLAVFTAIAMMFGAACFAGLRMNGIGKVSGWIGLPQYENQIPKLQWYGTLWESLTIAMLFIAAFILGLGKRVRPDEVPRHGAHLRSIIYSVLDFVSSAQLRSYYCWV